MSPLNSICFFTLGPVVLISKINLSSNKHLSVIMVLASHKNLPISLIVVVFGLSLFVVGVGAVVGGGGVVGGGVAAVVVCAGVVGGGDVVFGVKFCCWCGVSVVVDDVTVCQTWDEAHLSDHSYCVCECMSEYMYVCVYMCVRI